MNPIIAQTAVRLADHIASAALLPVRCWRSRKLFHLDRSRAAAAAHWAGTNTMSLEALISRPGEIGIALRALRGRAGLSLPRAARAIGVNTGTLFGIEHGYMSLLTINTLLAASCLYADALGVAR
ncbi:MULTISPECIES: helix-turn-helix domain-containing protein [unclassified Rathayibacter]|uniref:helix-turn-helix domain-containing protein n=1 Tax=unclassified Rathayibacter TaxID=2609250 RepID=UPI0006FA1C7F|nr:MULTISPECIES: helix-turn-helix transcriptional regulator [unclassified Rathayibacter]KQQ00589.1 hypothetical protein ASF42_14640 [Rathayibacter sp. Leaf294]KQS10788.1 hypothetical protein ASG06_14640 [Rathayibacter sp. Leaf185]